MNCERCGGRLPYEAYGDKPDKSYQERELVKPNVWEERVRLALSRVTEFLTRPER
jgi:hypothetical protein